MYQIVRQHNLYITSHSTKLHCQLQAVRFSVPTELLRPCSWQQQQQQQQHSGLGSAAVIVSRVIVSWWQATACLVFERSTFYTWPTVKKQGIVSLLPSDFSEPYNYLAKRLGPLYKCTRDGGVLCEGCSDVRRCVFRVTALSDGITPSPSCSSKNTMTA